MSKLVEAKDLRERDVFEMTNGSVYVSVAVKQDVDSRHMRLWCVHPPEPVTFEPPLVALPVGETVRLLTGDESYAHHQHPGYVEALFRTEMDRRHHGLMSIAVEKMNRANAEQLKHDRAARPWWKKVFG